MNITLETVRDKWSACYPADLLATLYPVPRTAVEVLTLRDGPWAEVPAFDRLWTVFHEGVLSDSVLRLSACDSAIRALDREIDAGREPHPASWNAVAVAKQFALGNATAEEMYVARAAACTAACTAARAAANAAAAAAAAAANTAANAAFAAAAANTAAAAANAVAGAATNADHTFAAAAERQTQIERLLTIMKENA